MLTPNTIVAPGTLGLNKENEFNLLDSKWATTALNMVFDRSGRLGSRDGWTKRNSAASAAEVLQRVHEVYLRDGTVELIASGEDKIWRVPASADLTDAANDITSSTAPSNGLWKFLNFNNKCVGIQAGETAIVYTGTGDFADISPSSGTLPDGNAAAAAFGRLFVSDANEQDVQYCALLDEADWGGSDTGALGMASIWTQGTDRIMAIESIGANLIVFGRKHIVIWASSGGTELGLDPTDMYVADIIEGTGCIARDSVQVTGEGDVLFLSKNGVQSLNRVISQKNNPIDTLTKHIRTTVRGYLDSATEANISSVWSAKQGHYVLLFPDSNTSVMLDTRRFIKDEQGDVFTPATTWQHTPALADAVEADNGEVYQVFDVDIGQYTGSADNDTAYTLTYLSAWFDPSEGQAMNNLKELKELASLVFIAGSITAIWSWSFDFGSGESGSDQVTYTGGAVSEFGVAEWGVSEFGGGVTTQRKRSAGSREGQFIQIGANMSINNAQFILQQMTLFQNIGRMI